MHLGRGPRAVALAVVFAAAPQAYADYHSHPELKPDSRCITADGQTFEQAGIDRLHCQKLIWDIPVTTEVGHQVIAAPAFEDTVPRWPRGLSDRIPPLFVGNDNGDGYEQETDCTADNPSGCHRLCSNPLEVGYWKETVEAGGRVKEGFDGIDTPPHGENGQPLTAVNESTGEQVKDENGNPVPIKGPIMTLACRRGVRTYFGPWQVGTDQARFDAETSNQNLKFENTALLDHDQAQQGADPRRLEWNVASEFYNNFGSHHGTCYQPSDPCTDPNSPKPASAYDPNNPAAECYKYEKATQADGGCYAPDLDPSCSSTDTDGDGDADYKIPMGGFRNATQVPGRLSVPIPGGRGVIGTEDVVWGCNHHVVHQLPPGSYSMTELADFRKMKGGLTNNSGKTIFGVPNGQVIGGTIGEMIVQYFTEPLGAPVLPVNVAFNAVADAATTYYAPFTWNYHEAEWLAPFDAAVALGAIHSHHRMVKGIQSISPANPPRLNSDNPLCGGWKGADVPPTDVYTNWYWEDAPVCEWWREPDGPLVLRKGQSIRTACYVNNGVTPEAIKHGLVGFGAVNALRALGAPIPDYPETVPASTWGDPLKTSAVGREILYGTHEPINYRVVYKCADERLQNAPGTSTLNFPFVASHDVCSPNPAKDGDDDYIDGPYANEDQCGAGGSCEPSSIIFACVGEDEMCIGVNMYWGLARIGSDKNDEAVAALEEAVTTQNPEKLDEVGTPGNTGAPTDTIPGVFEAGNCPECAGAPSL
jgi:hypothetical protein